MRLKATILAIEEVDGGLRQQMWHLLAHTHPEVTRQQFCSAISHHHHAVVLRGGADQRLYGFLALAAVPEVVDRRRVVSVRCGDMAVHDALGEQRALERSFLRYLLGVKLRYPFRPIYWFVTRSQDRQHLLFSRESRSGANTAQRPPLLPGGSALSELTFAGQLGFVHAAKSIAARLRRWIAPPATPGEVEQA